MKRTLVVFLAMLTLLAVTGGVASACGGSFPCPNAMRVWR